MEERAEKEYKTAARGRFWDFLKIKIKTKEHKNEPRYVKEIKQELIELRVQHESLSKEFKTAVGNKDMSAKNKILKEISRNEERQDGIKKQIKVHEDKNNIQYK